MQNPNPVSEIKPVGKNTDSGDTLFYIGNLDNGEPLFSVNETPDDVDTQDGIRLSALLKFNPDGWDIDQASIDLLELKQDAFPTYKERVTLQPGIVAGITHDRGSIRHGNLMTAKYGLVLKTYGQAADGKSHDVYLGEHPDSDRLFKVWQTNPDGTFDEHKYIAHCQDIDEARNLYLRHGGQSRFGMIANADWEELRPKKSERVDTEDYPVPDNAEEVELPEDDTIAEDWQDSVNDAYSGILEAKDADDKTLAAGIAAAVLLAEWLFSEKRGTYLKPAKKGQKREELTPDELDQIAEDRINTAKIRLDSLNRKYSEQELFEDEWFDSAWSEVEQLHSQLFVLGRGGIERMDKRDRATLQSILRFQKYHLSTFLSDLMTTDVSEKQLFNRLRMYANSARNTYKAGVHQWAIGSGKTTAMRSLDPVVKEHCRQCPEYSTNGKYVPINQIVLPGVACDCQSNCQCRVDYR